MSENGGIEILNRDRQDKVMIYTINLLSKLKIEGLNKVVLNKEGEDMLKDLNPTSKEIDECLYILFKKGYISEREADVTQR